MYYGPDEWEIEGPKEDPTQQKLTFWDKILVFVFMAMVIAAITIASIVTVSSGTAKITKHKTETSKQKGQ